MHQTDLLHWVGLNRIEAVGPVSYLKLLEVFGSPLKVFKAPRKELEAVPGLRNGVAQAILNFNEWFSVEKELSLLKKDSIRIITCHDPLYPHSLKQISGFPPLIYVRGQWPLNQSKDWLGVVGSRAVSEYGVMACRKLVRELVSQGIVIVSGYARGVDITAHLATVEQKGQTVAVLGCGLKQIHPISHRGYQKQILEQGAFVSEFPYSTLPLPQYFPRRNRIISGLSRGVLVIEAGEKSGALITAQYALEQNRDLFAVPGSILSSHSSGCNRLIQQGAKLVTKGEDILNEWQYIQSEASLVTFRDPEEGQIHQVCQGRGLSPDEIVEKTGFAPEKVTVLLTKLELQGKIDCLPGRRYQSV